VHLGKRSKIGGMMAIFAIGAFFEEDVSSQFINNNLAGVGWNAEDAPDLHQFIRSLKVGDIIYIKAFPPGGDLIVKAIGIIINEEIHSRPPVSCGRNVRWLFTAPFTLQIPRQKNNVRANTLYEEYHPQIQNEILKRIMGASQHLGAIPHSG
jgi:hypothetical protein